MKIKGFNKDLRCRGMQFEVGKTYDTGAKDDEIEICSNTVFHYCKSLPQVHQYYSCKMDNRFCEIEVLGAEVTDGDKCGSNKIKILREIVGDELNTLLGKVNGNSGLFNSGYCNSGNRNSGDRNSGYWNSGDRNSGNWNSGYCNSGDWNSGYCNSGDWNSGYCNSGDCNSGDFNSCDFSSGFFCTEEPKARVFNVEIDMTVSEFRKSEYYLALNSSIFYLTEWIEYSDEEKENDEEKARLGGFLKTYSFEEACKKWWDRMNEANKEIIMSIPNFDKEIFKEITGIEV